MKAKLAKVYSCWDCPERFDLYCELADRDIDHYPGENGKGIPDWCPLPDAEALPDEDTKARAEFLKDAVLAGDMDEVRKRVDLLKDQRDDAEERT